MPRTPITIPRQPTRALHALTAVNVAVFALWQLAALSGPDALAWMEANFTVSLDALRAGRVWTLLTSEVSHAGLLHLGFNLWALRLFGDDLEQLLGWRGLLHLYGAGAVAASIGHVAFNALGGDPTAALGASGAVMSVAIVSSLMHPRRWLLLFFVIPLPALWAMALFVVIDLIGLLSPGVDNVAHAAHLGGALYGVLYWRYEAREHLIDQLVSLGVIPPPNGARQR